MGQQVPFETLDDVAEGLLGQDQLRRGGAAPIPPMARTVLVGDQRLQRLELKMVDADGTDREVHVYEAYWAPLTEGRVPLRDVVSFLLWSAIGSIRSAQKPFTRWLFGEDQKFPPPIRTVMYLIVALAVVIGLGVLNAIIVTMAVARAPLHTPPGWLSDSLFADITTVLNILITVFMFFGATIAVSMWARPKQMRLTGWLSIATFAAAVWTTIAGAITTLVIIAYHARRPDTVTAGFFDLIGWGPAVSAFDRAFDWLAVAVIVAAAGWAIVRWGVVMTLAVLKDLRTNPDTAPVTRRVRDGFVALVVTLLAFTLWLIWKSGVTPAIWRRGLAWPLLVAASAIVRWFLIEFVGDVAAYIQPHVVDRFNELRIQIKEQVWRTAHAIYSATEYEQIVLVGHSLGSVVMYDVLNRLILDRQLNETAPDVVDRTKLLLTFGSPLDKTAFLFGIQSEGGIPGAARRALAATVQPLITEEDVRPPWVNIYSAWDIISGALDYYDRPDRSNRLPIDNVHDPAATTLLAAHVEYWKNPAVFRTIVEYLR